MPHERVNRPAPPRGATPNPGDTARLLREVRTALRESAAEHGYRAEACRVIRDLTLRRYHDQHQERLWALADDVDLLAATYAKVHKRTQAQQRDMPMQPRDL